MSKKIQEQAIPEEPINDWGWLYRTQYLVLSRTLLEAMPIEWQKRFVSLMKEVGEEFDYDSENWKELDFYVRHRDSDWCFSEDPFWEYRNPNREYIESIRKKK